jgi:membrane-associated phospholipid phosphatase
VTDSSDKLVQPWVFGRKYWLILGLCGFAIVPSLLWLDQACHEQVMTWSFRGDFSAILEFVGLMGHGITSVLVAMLIWNLDRPRRRLAFLVLLVVMLCGTTVTLVKVSLQRPRPYIAAGVPSETPGESKITNSDFHSFPSGHTAVAFGLATSLSLLYPQGKVLFFGLASLVGIQRIITQAHYPSDVLAGLLVGVITAQLVFQIFDWIKLRLMANSADR